MNRAAFFSFLKKRRAMMFVCLFGGMLVALFLSPLRASVFIETLENTVLSWRFRQRGPIELSPDVRILGVDASSFKVQENLNPEDYVYEPVLEYMLPEWPWDKRVFARVLEKLMEAGARMVIFDFVFFSESEGDTAFSAMLERYRDRVVLASLYKLEETVDGGHAFVFYEPNDDVLPWPRDDEDNYEDLIGFANVLSDADKQVRRAYYQDSSMGLYHEANPILEFSSEAVFEYDLKSMAAVAARKLHPGIGLPSPEEGVLINYAGAGGSYTMIPVERLFFKTRWEKRYGNGAIFKDKIVFVGPYSEAQFKDIHPTPLGTMPGPEVQANLLVSLLRKDFIRPLPEEGAFGLAAVLTFLALWIFLKYQHVSSKLLAIAIVSAVFVIGTQVAFEAGQMLVPVSGFVLCFFGCGNLAMLYDFMLEQHDKRRIHGMFGTYVSREVVDQMVASGQEPKLGGAEETVTCFFSDVQSFSSFSEVLTPAQLVELMNEYLTAMTDILHLRKGTLDKYIGDAIVAMFGAPIRSDRHAYDACLTACRMQQRQAELREKWRSEGDKWPERCHQMRTRIGLNTGEVTVGNMGSVTRFNYTFMGDNVNLAARCESGAKSYGVYTMVSESTYEEALRQGGEELLFRYLDKIIVKGRTKPVAIYELMGVRSECSPAHLATLEHWERGMAHYLGRRWAEAIMAFEEALQYEPHHPERCLGSPTTPSHVMLERCKHYQADPPPEDWDGVFVMKSK